MTSRPDLERRLRDTNPAPFGTAKPPAAWSSEELMARIDGGIAAGTVPDMRTTVASQRVVPRRRRGPLVALAAAVTILIPGLAWMLYLGGTNESDVATTIGDDRVEVVTTVGDFRLEADASDVPYYALFPEGQILHDDEWAIIVFHRPPTCIPPNANLLELGDLAAVANCGPVAVDGVVAWDGDPALGSPPIETQFTGTGDVPVWLVPWPAIEAIAGDGVLTRRDLLSMQSRIEASATEYQERSRQGVFDLTARGELADGRPFSFSISGDASGADAILTLPFDVQTVTEADLDGVWENRRFRIEFGPGAFLRITGLMEGSWRGTGPVPSAEMQPSGVMGMWSSEGVFELDSGLVTLALADPVPCSTATYFAGIGEDGRLVLDYAGDPCSDSLLAEPLSRVE